MKPIKILSTTIFFLLILTLPIHIQANTVATASPQFAEDEVIVKLKPSAPSSDINPLAQAISGEVAKELLIKDTFVLKVPAGSVEKVIKTLSDMPQVATATPNYTAHKQAVTNDTALQKSWGLFQIQAASSSSQSAWDKTAGRPDITVAVLDTGIEKTHPDLEGKVIAEKNFTRNPDARDRDGHGTLVAGVIAATGNNSSGIAGVSYNSTLMNVKVLHDNGQGTYADIADGIVWAADQGAKVINLSLGGPADLQLLEDAVQYAYNKGVVLVAAAGNSGNSHAMYPAHYEQVLSVAATDDSDSRLSLSNYGNSVQIAAPGDKIYSTFKNNSYSHSSGTSMAAAFASGVAALVWSSDICTTNICVLNRIESSADAVSETGSSWKFGRINALHAITGKTQEPSGTAQPSLPHTSTAEPALRPAPSNTIEPGKAPVIATNSFTISDIEMWTTGRLSRKDLFIRVKTTKQSDNNNIGHAEVTIDLITPDGTIYTGSTLTNIQGEAVFALRGANDRGIYKTQIMNVSMEPYIYQETQTKSELLIN